MTDEAFPIEDWLLNLPLYTPVALGPKIDDAVEEILLFEGTLDSYCPDCQQNATFMGVHSVGAEKTKAEEQQQVYVNRFAIGHLEAKKEARKLWQLPVFSKAMVCTRAGHFVHFHFVSKSDAIIKIGQNPSLSDMATGETAQFEKALGKTRLRELNKAIGLAAHGVGIGSFVYLRRVFESLIEEAHQNAAKVPTWDEAVYQTGRMKEKISMLNGFLPEFITQHLNLYGILSLGVHELTEEECMRNFEVLKSSILVVAEEKMHEIQRAKRYREASLALSSLTSEIKK